MARSQTGDFEMDNDASPVLLDRLSRALPRNALLVGDAMDPRYQEDRRGGQSARPRFVARPSTTEEVAACLAACNEFGQRLVVQGGRTGLAGGHRVNDGEAVLSTERMTELGEVQPLSRTLLASAGTPLQAVQEIADAAGYQFGVDIGARGTATVGGNVATNAGGIRVLRYGMFRAQVAGLEAVLANGTVLSALRGLDKDNAGYDLNQLFIGSEGTLGVVTRVLLRLRPKPIEAANALLAVPSLEAALRLLERLRGAVGSGLSAFELMVSQVYDGVTEFLGMARPVAARQPFYVLAEVQSFHEDHAIERFSTCLMEALEDGLAEDAIVSQSPREFQSLWTMREACADFVHSKDNIMGGDISVPLHCMWTFLEASRQAVQRVDPESEFLIFGHLGDGNLHYVIRTPLAHEAMQLVYRLAAESGGSIAAEHGIGIDKKRWLALTRSETEVATMRQLKAALDPRGILNRGRIFDS
ncbi:MAG: FAD-binding oxidoreductase [Rhizobiaceae bacterium]